MKQAMTILRWLLGILLTLVLLVNLYFIGMRVTGIDQNPKFLGHSTALVLSGSMEPAFSPGDLLLIREEDRYEVGDIVMFRSGGSFVTHRIVDEAQGGFVTQGDANNAPDAGTLLPGDIEGRYLCVIPLAGPAMTYLRSPLGLLSLVLLALALWTLPAGKPKGE